MKESNFYSDDFEELIREKTEQYKMYPSDKVWKGVNNSLHKKRKWFIGSMALLVTGILFMAGKELIAPAHPVIARKAGTLDSSASPETGKANTAGNTSRSILTAIRGNASGSRHGAAADDLIDEEESAALSPIDITVTHPVISLPDLSQLLKQIGKLSDKAPALPVLASRPAGAENETSESPSADFSYSVDGWTTRDVASVKDGGAQRYGTLAGDALTIKDLPVSGLIGSPARDGIVTRNTALGRDGLAGNDIVPAGTTVRDNLAAAEKDAASVKATLAMRDNPAHDNSSAHKEEIGPKNNAVHPAFGFGPDDTIDDIAARNVLASLSERGVQQALLAAKSKGKRQGKPYGIINEDLIPDSTNGPVKLSAAAIAESEDRQRINWLHEYAMYTLPVSEPKPRAFLQLTIAPTISFRSLGGGDFSPSKNEINGPITYYQQENAHRYVDHSPGLGFEVGGSLVYRLTRNFSVKGGLQFNFSQYTVKAYNSNNPQLITSNLSGYGSYVDSMTSYARLGSYGGQNSVSLTNDFYQLSAPIGFELRLLGNERLTVNVGATIQPSYLFNTNMYGLSSDYTSYAKEPSQIRHWNWNAGLEAFLAYRIKSGLYWQIGPEFRYQLHSTYTSDYPVNETQKTYGIRFGIVKSLP